jgi:hypothetical protein
MVGVHPTNDCRGGHKTWLSLCSLQLEYDHRRHWIRFHRRNSPSRVTVANNLCLTMDFRRLRRKAEKLLLAATECQLDEDKDRMAVAQALTWLIPKMSGFLGVAYFDYEEDPGVGPVQNHPGTRSSRLGLLTMHRGMVGGTRPLFHQRLTEGVAVRKLLVLVVGRVKNLWSPQTGAAACRDCAPRGRSCSLSSGEYSLRIVPEDHLGQGDIVSFFADSVLR